jgi:hypothetical protein
VRVSPGLRCGIDQASPDITKIGPEPFQFTEYCWKKFPIAYVIDLYVI